MWSTGFRRQHEKERTLNKKHEMKVVECCKVWLEKSKEGVKKRKRLGLRGRRGEVFGRKT